MAEEFLQLFLLCRTDPELAAMLGNIVFARTGDTNLAIVHGLHGYFLLEEELPRRRFVR